LENFDPNSLKRYCVIALPHRFGGEDYDERKIFVVLCHHNHHTICLKATSRVDIYKNNKEAMAGVVFYQAGQFKAFHLDTAVQPDNCVAIPHEKLRESKQNLKLDVFGTLPGNFQDRLLEAIDNSLTLDDRQRKRLLNILENTQSS
jgi:hypothetical protein